jgi:uracil-DNA glycosylase family 4
MKLNVIVEPLMTLMQEVQSCTKCTELANTRTQTVFGYGPTPARLLFLGEAPGADEDKLGVPFVGQAGKLLDNIIAACEWNRKEIFICNILKCLDGYTAILTEDGYKLVNSIVKHHYSGKVRCVDKHGNLQWGEITGWHKTPLADRRLYKVHLANSRNQNHISGGTFTEDHELLTTRGFVKICELLPTDKIHSGTLQPSKIVREAIIGTMLGDSQFFKKSNSFACHHSYKQLPYVIALSKMLGVGLDRLTYELLSNKNGKTYMRVGFFIKASPYYRKLCKLFYGNGKKHITKEILDEFTIVSLAFLYMDDGYIKQKKKIAEIATCDFSAAEVDLLISKIKELGIECYRRPNSKYPRIYFDVPNTEKLSAAIACYVDQSLDYKLLPLHRLITKTTLCHEEEPFFDSYNLIRQEFKEKQKWTYCIDVKEYGNFITRSGVAHNCRPPNNRRPTKEESCNCRGYLDKQIDLVNPEWIVCWGATSACNLLGKEGSITSLRGETYNYKKAKVICTYHPAYLLPHRNPSKKKEVWEDLQVVIRSLRNENQ